MSSEEPSKRFDDTNLLWKDDGQILPELAKSPSAWLD